MRRSFSVFSGFAFLCMISLSSAASGQVDNPSGLGLRDRTPQFVPNQILVRFRAVSSESQIAQLHRSAAARVMRRFDIVPGLQLVTLDPGSDFPAVLAKYRADASVLYAEPNYIRKAVDNTPNDLYFHDLWNMHNTGQRILDPYPSFSGPLTATPGADIQALQAWGVTTGSSDVVLGLIDTGVDFTHEDLAANIYSNQADCNNNGIDDDGNGYIDDCHGINTLDGNSDVTDQVGHGTHVAGIMGAAGNNALGVVGVNWKVKILTCKFLGFNGGTDDGAVACLNYMAIMKDRGVNIVATNNSWGGYGYSQALYDAIDAQRKRGILFVAAAGNSNSDNDGPFPFYPASFALNNIIAVAASDFADSRSAFSSFGAHTVAISAPGDHILSTTPDNTYSVFSGTSMAAPHVTGVAGLLKAQDPTRDAKAIRNLILAGGDKLPNTAVSLTHSRLNAFNSLTCSNRTVNTPLQPQSASVLASSGKPVTLSALNINCGSPAGAVAVAVTPGGQQVALHDDGAIPDQDPNDGVYSGQWTPGQSGLFTLAFPVGQQIQVAVDPYNSSSVASQYRTFTGTNLNLKDENFAFIQSPFPISFAGGAFQGILVSDNGYLSVDSYGAPTPAALPYQYSTTLIAPFWDRLVPTSFGNVYWTVNGTTPNRELVIEWRNMSHTGCKLDGSETVTFEVVLFESTPDLLFNYAKTAFGGTCTASNNGATASIGIQSTATVAQQLSFNSGSLADNTAIHWTATLPSNIVPTVSKVFPTSWVTDILDTFVELTGTGFNPNSVLLVNGTPVQSFQFSSTDLIGFIPASNLATTGALQLAVFNGLPGGGPSQPVTFPINPADFTLGLANTTVTLKAGQSATTTVFAYPNPAFNAGVTLSCSGLPSYLTCSFDPGRILTDSFAVVTFTAKPLSASANALSARSTGHSLSGWLTVCLPVFGILWCGALQKSRLRMKSRARTLFVVAMLSVPLGCGGGGGAQPASSSGVSSTGSGGGATNPTPASSGTGTTAITVMGTSGSIQHSVTINVTVTQ